MRGVSRIALTEDISLITFSHIPNQTELLADIFRAFADAGVNIDMISQTAPQGQAVSLSFTVGDSDEMIRALEVANQYREAHPTIKPLVSTGNCKLQLQGEEMRSMHGVVASAMAALAACEAEILLITTSEIDFSILVTAAQAQQAYLALQKTFAL